MEVRPSIPLLVVPGAFGKQFGKGIYTMKGLCGVIMLAVTLYACGTRPPREEGTLLGTAALAAEHGAIIGFVNATGWTVRVYINPDPNNVEATTPVVIPPNQVVPSNLDIGSHRIIARAYVNTQFGERLVGKFTKEIEIFEHRPGWFLKVQDDDFR